MSPSTIDALNFLKQYKREKRLGEGGEGEADLWVHTKSEMTNIRKGPALVVVKTIKKPKDKLPREALFLDQLKQYDHTNIIEMFGYVQTDIPSESLRVMLEYCNEGDLEKVVNDLHLKEQAITEFMLWDITLALLSALAFLHNGIIDRRTVEGWRPIIHRDIKPQNILSCLRLDGTLHTYKLADFGVCNYYDPNVPDPNDTGRPTGNHLRCLSSQHQLPMSAPWEPSFIGLFIASHQ
jgi:serine/threonine protein kinase